MKPRIVVMAALAAIVALPLASFATMPSVGTAQAAQRRPVQAEDLYKIAQVSDTQISPDGRFVAFVVTRVNGPKDRYDSNLYLVRTDGSDLRQITHTGKDGNPVWSPDSRTIAFDRGPQKKGQFPQIFAYSVATGTARQLTHARQGAGGAVYSHDGSRIAYGVFSVDPPHAAWVNFSDAGFKPGKDQKTSDIRIIHDLRFEGNGQGFTYDKHAHISVMNADGSGAHALTSGSPWSEGNPQWSPDDRTIAFDSLRREAAATGENDVYLIPARGGAMHRIATGDPSTNLIGYDNAGHLWTARAGVVDPAQFFALVRSSGEGNNPHTLIPANTVQFGDTVLADMGEPGGLCGFTFAPHDAFFVSDIDEKGYSALVRVDPETGDVTPLTKAGEASMCSMNRAGTAVAYTLSDFTHPREVYVMNLATGESRRLTGFNDAYLATVALSQPQEFTIKDDAGFDVQAWFMPAVGPHAGGKRPTILDIHGGPQTQFGQTFFHEFQFWAGQGYNVVFSDPRGSVGHGYAFEAALSAHWGEAMFDDVQRVMDRALQFSGVDATRQFETGGSYGGYATLWVVSHTDRYKAAIAERAVSNMTSEELVADFAGSNGFGGFTTKYGFGNPWDPRSRNYPESPLTYVENVHTPLMLLHSEEDTRTPYDQTIQEYSSLKILGRDVTFVDVPGENHDLSRDGAPIHRVERLHIMADYFGKFLK